MKLKLWSCMLVLLLAVTLVAGAMAEEGILTVQGNGVVHMDADRATITVGVREIADDVMAAQSLVNEKIDAILKRLTDMGVNMQDIYTDSINIYPNYDYSASEEKIVGYTAYNSISATMDDIDNVGTYIDAAFEAGANTLDNVVFSASDSQDAAYQAVELAVKDASEKSKVLAEAAGMQLGGIVEIEEQSSYSYNNPTFRYAEASVDSAAGTQVIASQLQLSAAVSVKYELIQE